MLAQTVSIIEPNCKLNLPYDYIPDSYNIVRAPSIEYAVRKLTENNPSIVFMSASFSVAKSIRLLEALKIFSCNSLIPIIIVVDLSNRINFVPGTTWGGKIAVIDSHISQKELYSTMGRVFK